jgi:Repeat of unknown function (DUF5648)
MPIGLNITSDAPGKGTVRTVGSGDGFFALDGDDSLFSSTALKAFQDGALWEIPCGLSGGKGNDYYSIGYSAFAVIADAGFGKDKLKIYRSITEATWSARIDGRHLAATFESFPGSAYRATVLIIDAFKPEGSIESTELDGNVILDTSYNQLPSLIASAGISFEELSWDQAIAKKYLNLSVVGVTNNSSGADQLMDLIYKTGNPVTEPGVHRFFNPSKGVHFYSNDLNEVNHVRSRLGNYWYEGKVYDPVTGAGAAQLYRFFNPRASYHFMTTSANEAAIVAQNPSWGYQSEGLSYSVSTTKTASATTPVYRFYRVVDGMGQHFYTSSEAERQNILANPAWGYQYEGIAWYAK